MKGNLHWGEGEVKKKTGEGYVVWKNSEPFPLGKDYIVLKRGGKNSQKKGKKRGERGGRRPGINRR